MFFGQIPLIHGGSLYLLTQQCRLGAKQRLGALALSLAATTLCGWPQLAQAAPPAGDFKLVWFDEFNGSALNTTNWSYRYLGARNDAYNVSNAVAVSGGALAVTTYTQNGTNFTGMIGTQNKFEHAYGYWEARIDFDSSPGMWSAFWLQSPTYGNPLGDPGTAGMEIDVMEHRARNFGNSDVSGTAHLALHWDGYGVDHKTKSYDTSDLDLDIGFHTYGLLWTPTCYSFYIDGALVWTNGPLAQRTEYMILSSEVRNNNWAGTIPVGGYGDLGSSQTKMIVDYVRVYDAVPEPTTCVLVGAGAGCLWLRRRYRRPVKRNL
jgi:beta-glucanase (GH16 family)